MCIYSKNKLCWLTLLLIFNAVAIENYYHENLMLCCSLSILNYLN